MPPVPRSDTTRYRPISRPARRSGCDMSLSSVATFACLKCLPLLRPYAPDGVSDIIRNEQRARFVDGNADRTSMRITLLIDKSRQHILGVSIRAAVRERNEDHFVAAERLAIPRAVLA